MPSATVRNALPYPLPGDALAVGDDVIKALADRVDLVHGTIGAVVVNVATAGGTGSTNVVYPQAFTVAPFVWLQMETGPGALTWVTPYPSARTTAGFTCNVRAAIAGNYTIIWACRL